MLLSLPSRLKGLLIFLIKLLHFPSTEAAANNSPSLCSLSTPSSYLEGGGKRSEERVENRHRTTLVNSLPGLYYYSTVLFPNEF